MKKKETYGSKYTLFIIHMYGTNLKQLVVKYYLLSLFWRKKILSSDIKCIFVYANCLIFSQVLCMEHNLKYAVDTI